MRDTIKLIAVAGLSALALLGLYAVASGGGYFRQTTVREDSSYSQTWAIGDTTGGAGLAADFDTSEVYDARYWDLMTMQVKSSGFVDDLDSGGVVFVVQMSNDQIYWTPVDSLTVADSTAAFKTTITLPEYRWLRFVGHHSAKTDSSGARASLIINVKGEQ